MGQFIPEELMSYANSPDGLRAALRQREILIACLINKLGGTTEIPVHDLMVTDPDVVYRYENGSEGPSMLRMTIRK